MPLFMLFAFVRLCLLPRFPFLAKVGVLLFFSLSAFFIRAFSNHPPGDCPGAIRLCGVYQQNNPIENVGNIYELHNSCLASVEDRTLWFRFKVQSSGTFGFRLIPDFAEDNFDFALYNITSQAGFNCENTYNRPPERCNISRTPGPTGLADSVFTPLGVILNEGPAGAPFMDGLFITQGQEFTLVINQTGIARGGFQLRTLGTARLIDEVPLRARLLEDTLCANTNTHLITLFFNKRLACSEVNAADFEIVTQEGAESFPLLQVNCQQELVDIIFRAPPAFREGTLLLKRKGIIPDLCNGFLEETIFPFWLSQFQTMNIIGAPNATCAQTPMQLGLSWRSQLPVVYRWEFGSGAEPSSFIGASPPRVSWQATTNNAVIKLYIESRFCFAPILLSSSTIRITEPSPMPQWSENSVARCGPGTFTVQFQNSNNISAYRLYASSASILPFHITSQAPWRWSTPNFAQDTVFWVEGVNASLGCVSQRKPLLLKINPIPQHPSYKIEPLCAPGRPILSWESLPPGLRLEFFASPGANFLGSASFPQTEFLLPNVSQSTNFYINITDLQTFCVGAQNSVIANVKNQALPRFSYIGNAQYCAGQRQTLRFAGLQPGATLKMYESPESATALATSLPGSSEIEWIFSQGASRYYFQQWAPALQCVSGRQEQVFYAFPAPPFPAAENQSQDCPIFTFRVSLPPGFGLRLYDSPVGGARLAQTFLPAQEGVRSPVITQTTTFYLAAFDPQTGCESPRNAVTANYFPPSAPEPNTTIVCQPGRVTLSLQPLAGEEFLLQDSEGALLHIFSTGAGSYFTPFLTSSVTYYVTRKVGNCQSAKSPWVIRVSALRAPQYSSQARCGAGPVRFTPFFQAGAASVALYTQPTGGEPQAIAGMPNFELITPYLSTSTRFYIEARDSLGCVTPRTVADANIRMLPPMQPPVSSSVTFCPGQSATFTFQPLAPEGELIRIYTLAQGGEKLAELSGAPYLYTTPLLNASATFYVAAAYRGQECESERRAVFAIAQPLPPTPLATDFIVTPRCGEGEVTLTALKADYPTLLSVNLEGPALATFSRTPSSFRYFAAYSTHFYLVAQDPRTGCKSLPLTLKPTLYREMIAAPRLQENRLERCGPGRLQFSFLPPSQNTYVIRVYSGLQADASFITIGSQPYLFETPVLSGAVTYYAAIYDEKTTCQSPKIPLFASLSVSDSVFHLSIEGAAQIRCGETAVLRAITNRLGVAFQWLPENAVSSPNGAQTAIAPKQTTTYTLLGAYNGCVLQVTRRVEVPLETIAIQERAPALCNGEPSLLSIDNAIMGAVWSPAEGLNRSSGNIVEALPSQNTVYTVTGLKNGCRAEGSIFVPARLPLRLSLQSWPPSNDASQDGRIIVTPQAGTPPFYYTYEGLGFWQTSSTFNNLSAGVYNLIVRDRNGCRATATVNLAPMPAECGPIKELQIMALDYQNARFQWNLVSGAAQYEYTLLNSTQEIVAGPITTASNQAIVALPPAYRNFIIRVRAICIPGFSFSAQTSLAFSAPSCAESLAWNIESGEPTRATIRWAGVNEVTEVSLSYRVLGSGTAWQPAYQGPAALQAFTLERLSPNTFYEIRLIAFCAGQAAPPRIFSFRTANLNRQTNAFAPKLQLSWASVAPNPTQNYWLVSFSAEAAASNQNLLLYDAYGKIIKSLKLELENKAEQEILLDASDLAPGVYLLELGDARHYAPIRLVKN
jgi:hypothetical protein